MAVPLQQTALLYTKNTTCELKLELKGHHKLVKFGIYFIHNALQPWFLCHTGQVLLFLT